MKNLPSRVGWVLFTGSCVVCGLFLIATGVNTFAKKAIGGPR